MATNRRALHLRLVTVDGTQIAPAPRIARGGWKVRQDREITLAIIHEHLGHLTHEMADATHSLAHIAMSVNRIQTLTRELEASLGISIPDFTPHQLPRRPSSPPDQSA
jgi:chromosome segregation ATPase